MKQQECGLQVRCGWQQGSWPGLAASVRRSKRDRGGEEERRCGEQLEAACMRAMAAGASSSGFVEQLLKSGRPLVDAVAEDGIGHHGNIRGAGYYH